MAGESLAFLGICLRPADLAGWGGAVFLGRPLAKVKMQEIAHAPDFLALSRKKFQIDFRSNWVQNFCAGHAPAAGRA
jgi:hypothetical protein